MEAHASLTAIHQRAEEWFDRARMALKAPLPCRRGCSTCCIGPFPITQLDLSELRRGLALLPHDRRESIQARAISQVKDLEAAYPGLRAEPTLDHWSDDTIDRLVTQFGNRPCPALQSDGSCGVYAFRPITCRMMGIPTESDGLVHGACSVQTAIPIVRLADNFRREEDDIAKVEAEALVALQQSRSAGGDEVLLPYGFLPDVSSLP